MEYPEPFATADFQAIRTAVERAVHVRGWLAITAPAGAGKTFASTEALAAVDAAVVHVMGVERKKWSARVILNAFFDCLPIEETPRHTIGQRMVQLARLIGEMTRRRPVVVYLDEAHQLPGDFFAEVKNLRESMRYGTNARTGRPDQRPLFSVVMSGWPELARRIEQSDQLGPRIRRVEMQGLSKSETAKFIAHVGAEKLCTKETIRALGETCHFPLAILRRLREGMARAHLRGARLIEPVDVAMSARELFRLSQWTVTELARAANVSPATASQVVNEGPASAKTAHKLTELLSQRVAELERSGAQAG